MIGIAAALAVVAAQGQAVELAYADEPGLASVEATWEEHRFPLVKHDALWVAVVGVDLDSKPGEHAAEVTFHYGDGRSRSVRDSVTVKAQKFPTTELKVEDKYVELSPADAARATREAQETDALYATLTQECYWSEPFVAPIHGAKDGRNFGHRRVFNGQPRAPHSGADLRADVGTPIYAANRGRVVLAKDLFYSGNAVIIDHGLGLYTMYLHLSKIDVVPGAIIERGARLGLAGATGRVTGPHLHWGVRIVDARVDPFSLLKLAPEPRGARTGRAD
ncbi:MAG TPA: peptidoglycan DD-metalloendopeptidase family protein [Gammaproteobacteria bacterium]|nr:peptidoglycan DD-metalloendopeptidase family protein [Gammaproteobacteria bacterium]